MGIGMIFAFAVGVVLTSVVFIIFGKNNKNKIAEARNYLLSAYNAASAEAKTIYAEALAKLGHKVQ